MKKLIALVLAAVMMMGVVSLVSAEPAKLNIGVAIYKYDDNFMTLYRTELEKYLKDMGHNVTIVDGKVTEIEDHRL